MGTDYMRRDVFVDAPWLEGDLPIHFWITVNGRFLQKSAPSRFTKSATGSEFIEILYGFGKIAIDRKSATQGSLSTSRARGQPTQLFFIACNLRVCLWLRSER
jgi:hypothetical protein